MTISKQTKKVIQQYLVILSALFIAYLAIWLHTYCEVNLPTERPIWSLGAETVQTPTAEANDAVGGKSSLVDPCTMPSVTCKTVKVSCYTGIESHGANGRNDGVSVATHMFPQGTWLNIEGFGKRRVDTVTAERFSDRVDIWFGNSQEAYKKCWDFGVRQLSIEVIK